MVLVGDRCHELRTAFPWAVGPRDYKRAAVDLCFVAIEGRFPGPHIDRAREVDRGQQLGRNAMGGGGAR